MTDKVIRSSFIQQLIASKYRVRPAPKTQHSFEVFLVDLS